MRSWSSCAWCTGQQPRRRCCSWFKLRAWNTAWASTWGSSSTCSRRAAVPLAFYFLKDPYPKPMADRRRSRSGSRTPTSQTVRRSPSRSRSPTEHYQEQIVSMCFDVLRRVGRMRRALDRRDLTSVRVELQSLEVEMNDIIDDIQLR